jgi:hypothetical protein
MGLESEYANCKTLYVLPPAGYNTQESNVPVMVRIGRSAGKYRDDTSDVFEKLGASYLKMAVSLDDGVTECPVEVTEWDVKRQLGILFVKIPSVPTTGMTLKLWYDPTHADNTTNVGAIGSAVGQSVWANGFEGVWHMKNSGGLVLDSTANANHGTIYGATEVDGPLGRCLSFDGADDYASVPSAAPTDPSSGSASILFTRAWATNDNEPHGLMCIGGYVSSAHIDYKRLQMFKWNEDNNWYFRLGDDGSFSEVNVPDSEIPADVLTYVTMTWANGLVSVYVNGVLAGTFAQAAPSTWLTNHVELGRAHMDRVMHGQIMGAWVSPVARSPAWIALTHASLKDELIAFSTPGTESLSGNERMRLTSDGKLVANEFVEIALTGNERMRLKPDGTLVADEFVEV